MYKFNDYYSINENLSQLKSLVKKSGSSQVDNGYGTENGVSKDGDDYQLLSLMISPDEKHKASAKGDVYGDIEINPEKERVMRPFLGLIGKMYYEEKCGLDVLKIIINWIIDNKQNLNTLVLKNNKTGENYNLTNILDIFKFKQQINDGRPAYEILTDAIRDKGGSDKVKEWVNKMPSLLKSFFKEVENYKKLESLLKLYDNLSEQNKNVIYRTFFGDGVSKGKISRFKNASDFLKSFKTDIQNCNNDFNIETIKKEILETKSAKLLVCDYEKGYIVADIWDYKASQKLGEVNNWCISYGASYWYETYMNYDSGNKMYFIWNFNVDSSNSYSHMGLCIRDGGSVKAFHDKFDNSINIDVLDKFGIEKNFIGQVTEEEYNYKELCHKRWKILGKPFKKYESSVESATALVDDIVMLINNEEDKTEIGIDILIDNILDIRDYEVCVEVLYKFFKSVKIEPIVTSKKVLFDFLSNSDDAYNIENVHFKEKLYNVVESLYKIYGLGDDIYAASDAIQYIKIYHKEIYDDFTQYIIKKVDNCLKIEDVMLVENIDIFLDNEDNYKKLLNYIKQHDIVGDVINKIFPKRNSFIKDMIGLDYLFEAWEIEDFMRINGYDLSEIKIEKSQIEELLKKFSKRGSKIIVNFGVLESLCVKNGVELYVVDDDVERMIFFINNDVPISKIRWKLIVGEKESYYKKDFLEKNIEDVYDFYKKGNIEILDLDFYYKHIVKTIFQKDLEIEKKEIFIESLYSYSEFKNIPLNKIEDIIELSIEYDNVNIDIVSIAIENNIGNIEKYLENIDYVKKSDVVLKELLQDNHRYVDKIISRIPNIEKWDMDDVGIYIKNVDVINKLLDVCKNPTEDLLRYIFSYGYEKDNKKGFIGDNEETIKLVDRLIKNNNEFKFSGYSTCYGMFDNVGLFLLKDFINKKYIDIDKLDKNKISREILNSNDYEKYIYFKQLGINYDLNNIVKGQNRIIIDDMISNVKMEKNDYIKILKMQINLNDFKYFYEKFSKDMDVSSKQIVVDDILENRYYSFDSSIDLINYLVSINDESIKIAIRNNWEENKRRKIYSDEVRNWIKNYLNPPKVKVKKIKEMFDMNYRLAKNFCVFFDDSNKKTYICKK